MDDLEEFLREEGYTNIITLPTGEVVALFEFIFTTGLIVGLDRFGYRIRFCFESAEDAYNAMKDWDGKGYPPGPWIKAKGKNEAGDFVDDSNPNK